MSPPDAISSSKCRKNVFLTAGAYNAPRPTSWIKGKGCTLCPKKTTLMLHTIDSTHMRGCVHAGRPEVVTLNICN